MPHGQGRENLQAGISHQPAQIHRTIVETKQELHCCRDSHQRVQTIESTLKRGSLHNNVV